MFENLGAEIIAVLAGTNLISTAIVIIREIGLSKLRATTGAKDIEIDTLQKTIENQSGQMEAMRESQVAIVNSVGMIGNMVNKAYMNSKLDSDTKTEIAILSGEIQQEVAKAAVIGLEFFMGKIEEGAEGMIENIPEGVARETAGALLDPALEVVEDLISQVPGYLSDIVPGND